MNYLNKYRVRYWVSAFFQIALFAAAFLPTLKIVGISINLVNVEVVSNSALWFLSTAGYPEIYGAILTVYGILSLPLIIFSFKREFKRAPIMIAAITGIIYLALNALLNVFILLLGLSGDFATSSNLTVWFWVYTVFQIAQIVHLFLLFFQIKKALTR